VIRHHTDHRGGRIVDDHGLADQIAAAGEVPLPGGVAEQRDTRTGEGEGIRARGQSVERRDAEGGEKLLGHEGGDELHRIAPGGRVRGETGTERGEGNVGTGAGMQVAKVAGRERRHGQTLAGVVRGEPHQGVRPRVGQGTEQNRVEQRVHRDRGADAEREQCEGKAGVAG
jgi:hypothetical protein